MARRSKSAGDSARALVGEGKKQSVIRARIDDAVAAGFEKSAPDPLPAEPASISNFKSEISNSSEPLPARMLNEFVYCPRLFYYEHVEGVFVHNADTRRGAAIHTRVDAGSGAMPSAASGGKSETGRSNSEGEEPEIIHSRSVSLGSERLGVTAKIDLVEIKSAQPQTGEDDLFARRDVYPVDYKAGAPREGDDGKEIWDADKMQLGLQCLLLRDNGYACKRLPKRVPAPSAPSRRHFSIRRNVRAARS